MKHDLQRTALDILSSCVDMSVATVRPDGAPQATVVSFAHDGLLIYFGCGADSQKAKNIAREPRVSITMTTPYGDWMGIRGLSIAAVAEEVTVPGELNEVWKLMAARFPQIASVEPAEPGAVKVMRVRPTMISILDYSKGFGHTDLVTIEAGDIAETLDSLRHHWLLPLGQAA